MVEVFEVFLEEGDGIETGWFITVLPCVVCNGGKDSGGGRLGV